MIKFATVGSGKIVDSFLDAAKRCPGFVHSAVYSRTEDRARAYAQKHGVEKTFTSLESLAADGEIDAVYIASPNYAHMRQSIQMLDAGKHVICEKPIGVNEGELDQMIAASKRNGVVLFEAMKTGFYTPGRRRP